ncbi:NAD(P)/FAD-dependent oxidoreductase [Alkalibacter rhizosphaerae]|uniref:NADH:ubiquinone reductase (non-electrogenic) n=1 Tax=Alkalibacter rhizosphaerae TaxID=2815577 RepID=A0A974XFT6_9FIRM|nr:NAD(P)/FAD-dependent oxidoreductase [Alkalibacter rhizosphaerae]QSX08966.1 NAD(P)/FAD-dependent oxidoreductase [Alkalibacter rhizosphaerae]
MSKKQILILGGSYAGVKAAKTLHKAFKKDENVEITVIDRHSYHTLMTELHEVAGHRTDPESIKIDLKRIFAGRKVNVVVDDIVDFDLENKKLSSRSKTYNYDYLIMGTGNEPNFFGIEGAKENAHTLWSYEDAIRLREHIEIMFMKASCEPDEKERRKLLTFAVCGGGFTGVEMVGELGEAKKHLAKKYDVNPKEVSIYNIEAMDRILNMLESDAQVEKVEKRYKKLGIRLLKNTPIVKIDDDSFTVKDGTQIPTYTLIWTAGIKNTGLVSSIGLDIGRCDRVNVNDYMQPSINGKTVENIYIVGDSACYIPEDDQPMPQIVEAAEQSAHTAAKNIISMIKGGELHKHEQKYHGFMVSVGSRYAVADVGFKSSGWFAMFVKHMVNVYYQFMVGGVRQIWNYAGHEFFHIKNKRSFVGGHFSSASKNFWKIPLRLWLGYMWLVEGVVKITEGWFSEPKVINMMNMIAGYDAGGGDGGTAASAATTGTAASGAAETYTAASGAAEAVTAASGATGGGGAEVVSELPGIFQWAVDKTPSGYGDSLMTAPKFMLDIMNKWMTPIEVPVQTVMVMMEIIIGLCLIAGLFTFVSSAASIVIGIGIVFTGMADASMIWYIVAGFATLQGAGSSFGLDYYVIPMLKNLWSKIRIVRKSYLYFDYSE